VLLVGALRRRALFRTWVWGTLRRAMGVASDPLESTGHHAKQHPSNAEPPDLIDPALLGDLAKLFRDFELERVKGVTQIPNFPVELTEPRVDFLVEHIESRIDLLVEHVEFRIDLLVERIEPGPELEVEMVDLGFDAVQVFPEVLRVASDLAVSAAIDRS